MLSDGDDDFGHRGQFFAIEGNAKRRKYMKNIIVVG